ncbi:MAG: hypothetical protein AB7F59_03535 [Bdellovibrionales bacterium]
MKTLIALFILLLSLDVFAQDQVIQEKGWFFNPSIFYWGDTTDYQSKRARTYFVGSVAAGYKNNGIFIGGIYDQSVEKWTDSGGSTEGDYVWTRTSWGPTVGVAYKAIYGFVTYYYFGELRDKRPNATEIIYKNGSGVQLSFGAQFEISERFFLGPQLSYRTFKFEKSLQDGVETTLSKTYIKTTIDPLLSLFFYF